MTYKNFRSYIHTAALVLEAVAKIVIYLDNNLPATVPE